MRRVVFYSWQSDLPNSTNRGFIQQALENAASAIAKDDSVAIEPVVDRDTLGVAGAPDIASTIFAKITAADVFVADVSIINRPKKGRPTPNPNVLIELGYALRDLGYERVILVFNSSYGEIPELPFDLRMRRIVTYTMPLETEDRSTERKKLQGQLEIAIRTALEKIPNVTELPTIPAISAIENGQVNKIIVLRRNLGDIFAKLTAIQPKKHSEGGTVDDLIQAIDQTQVIVAEFSKIAEIVVALNDRDCTLEIYKWFGFIFERYDLPRGHSGSSSNADFDYFKFIGHELFVTLVAYMIREQRWDMLKMILNEAIPVRYLRHEDGPGNVYWDFASEHLPLLLDESHKRRRISLHSDILHARHHTGGLSGILPFDEFVEADFSLFLYGELPPDQNPEGFFTWRPWSTLFMNHVPMFIKNAERLAVAEQIANVFNIASVDELKKRLSERIPRLRQLFIRGYWNLPFRGGEIQRIGTRQ